jgi:hypothetical protein
VSRSSPSSVAHIITEAAPAAEQLHCLLNLDMADRTRIAVAGCSARISRAASSPSVVCVGGIRASTIAASGRSGRPAIPLRRHDRASV